MLRCFYDLVEQAVGSVFERADVSGDFVERPRRLVLVEVARKVG